MDDLIRFLLISTAINYCLILLWFGIFVYKPDWIFGLHRRWFKLSKETFDAIHYAGMAIYKIIILVFNLVPLTALCVFSYLS